MGSSRSHNSSSSSRRRQDESTSQLISSLRSNRYRTLTELCRVERVAAAASESDQARFQEPMTSAWVYYVNSNNLLNELRGLTRDYPFDGVLLEEAKTLVLGDPASNRSWNFAWLVLSKIEDEALVQARAQQTAASPSMWGGRAPTQEEIDQLSDCFAYAWERAVDTMLRHWESPPTTTGY